MSAYDRPAMLGGPDKLVEVIRTRLALDEPAAGMNATETEQRFTIFMDHLPQVPMQVQQNFLAVAR